MGGGDGMPKGKKILKHLLNNSIEAEIAIVCGNNSKLFKQASKLKKKHQFENLKIYGFIDFVHSLINISDVVVTKCGASTFMEILLLGKVPVINNYIWEQEKGNMEFIRDNNMGIFERDIRKIPAIIRELSDNEEKHMYYTDNIEKEGMNIGTEGVTKFLLADNIC